MIAKREIADVCKASRKTGKALIKPQAIDPQLKPLKSKTPSSTAKALQLLPPTPNHKPSPPLPKGSIHDLAARWSPCRDRGSASQPNNSMRASRFWTSGLVTKTSSLLATSLGHVVEPKVWAVLDAFAWASGVDGFLK